MVGGKKKEKSDEKDMVNPYALKKIPAAPVYEKKDRKKLTEEEKAKKLREMEVREIVAKIVLGVRKYGSLLTHVRIT